MIVSLLALVGCQNEELVNETTDNGNGKKVTLTATIAGSTDSRVVLKDKNENGKPLTDSDGNPYVKVNWEESDEKFKVYGVNEYGGPNGESPTWFEQKPGTNQFEGTLPYTANGYFAVYGDPLESTQYPFQYSLEEQDGTLYQRNEHYSTVLMYAEFSNASPSITFQHMTAILKPTFKVGGNAINNTITQIVMGGVKTPTTALPTHEEITIAPTSPATTLGKDIYIHLPSVEGYSAEHEFTFTVTVGSNEYTGLLTIPTGMSIEAGKLYTATIDLTPYLTFSSSYPRTLSMMLYKFTNDTGSNITPLEQPFSGGVEYSIDGGGWMPLNEGKTGVFGANYGDLRLRGICLNGTINMENGGAFAVINFTGDAEDVICSGDIRTLVNYKEYQTTSTGSAMFIGLFAGCTALTDASGLKLVSNDDGMAPWCYRAMFAVCTSLTSAPVLPATTLAIDCYKDMFNGCSNLSSVTMLATDISAQGCLTNWLEGVAATGTLIKAASMTSLIKNSVHGIPPGWDEVDYVAQGI